MVLLTMGRDLAFPQMGQTASNASCPANVEVLVENLLTDLPNYANRVISRSRSLELAQNARNYVLIAGRPEFDPLSLNPGLNVPIEPRVDDTVKQVFFTTLERGYLNNNATKLEHFHWLFLTQTDSGWRVVTMYSRLDSLEDGRLPTPPLESSKSAIAQGINWTL